MKLIVSTPQELRWTLDDSVITSWELSDSGVMDETWFCAECHAEEIYGRKIPEDDPAILELYNGFHETGDDMEEIYLVDGYMGWFCCGGRELIRHIGTEELRDVISEVLRWRAER